MEYEVSVDIAADPARVLTTLMDVTHWSDWTPTVTSARRLDDGEFGVGSRVKLSQPKMADAEWQVTECEPDHSFVWESRIAGTRLVASHWARPADSGTGSTVVLRFDHTGALAGLMDLFAGKRIREYVDTEAASLKKYCETTPV